MATGARTPLRVVEVAVQRDEVLVLQLLQARVDLHLALQLVLHALPRRRRVSVSAHTRTHTYTFTYTCPPSTHTQQMDPCAGLQHTAARRTASMIWAFSSTLMASVLPVSFSRHMNVVPIVRCK